MITGVEIVQSVLVDAAVDAPVVSKVPMRRPRLFVRVDQAAPRRLNPAMDRALLMVQVYGVDIDAVVDLAHQVREILIDIDARHPNVFGWDEESGPWEFPDPDVPDEHRWQITGRLFFSPF